MTTRSAAAPSIVADKIAEYGAITRARLLDYLPDQEPRKYLYDLVAAYPMRPSGMMRPSLVIATAKAFGADTEDALNTAVAVELMHNAMLVHDDIEDVSRVRRGAPSLHRRAGVPLAMNAGDALVLLCLQPLLENTASLGPAVTLRVLEEAIETMFQTVEGQAWELGWRRDNICHVSAEDYLRMVTKKTSWYTAIFPCRAGFAIGSGRPLAPAQFVQFGYFLGATFQIQDDILNLSSDGETYRKDLAGDIIEGKRTLMLIHLMSQAQPDEQMRLRHYFAGTTAERRRQGVEWVVQLMERYRSLAYSRTMAAQYAGAALNEFSEAFGDATPGEDLDFIEALVLHALHRRA